MISDYLALMKFGDSSLFSWSSIKLLDLSLKGLIHPQILLKKLLTFSLNPYTLISIYLPISNSTEYPVVNGYLSYLFISSSEMKL